MPKPQPLEWDEDKREANLRKHGLDFADAHEVLGSRFRLDIPRQRRGEARMLSMSYVMGVLAVLSLVHTARGGAVRVISFRRASREEREAYREWLEDEVREEGSGEVDA